MPAELRWRWRWRSLIMLAIVLQVGGAECPGMSLLQRAAAPERVQVDLDAAASSWALQSDENIAAALAKTSKRRRDFPDRASASADARLEHLAEEITEAVDLLGNASHKPLSSTDTDEEEADAADPMFVNGTRNFSQNSTVYKLLKSMKNEIAKEPNERKRMERSERQAEQEEVTEILKELNLSTVPITVRRRDLERGAAQAEVKRLAKRAIAPAAGIMMTALLFGGAISSSRYTNFIPETLCTLAVAMVCGLGIREMINWGWLTFEGFTVVDATILNLFLLPIIIFEGGWSINVPNFMNQLPYIMIFAILGTILSTCIIGYGSWFLATTFSLHRITDLRTNLAFASIISATDPVATLATFAQLKIAEKQPLLNTLVFGESMMNDAVAILLFNAFNGGVRSLYGYEFPLGAHLVVFLFGSILMGCMVASALVFLLRVMRLPGSTVPETLYVFLSPYFVYAVTETMDLSGIIATLFAGIIFRLYGTQHLTMHGEADTSAFLNIVSRFADSGVFIICGTSTALMTSREGIHFGLIALALCLLSRAVMVQICAGLSNRLKRWSQNASDDMINWKHKFMIWLSGLRGGIGLVLSLEIDEKWCGAEAKSVIINTTFFLICALLLLCGVTTEPCLRLLGLSTPSLTSSPSSSDLTQGVADPDEVQWISLRRVHVIFQSLLVGDPIDSNKAADALLNSPMRASIRKTTSWSTSLATPATDSHS